MNLAALLAWFNPTRWLILGGVVLGLIAAQTGFYLWAHHKGYAERDDEQKIVEIKRQKDVAALEIKLAQANQKYQETHDALSKSAAGAAKTESARVRALLAERDRLRKSSGAVVPDAAVAAGCADDRARISEAAIDAARIAEQNADKVTGLQAWIESSRREQTKALGQKDARKPTDAETRLAARVKAAEDRAKRAEERAEGILK